MIGGVIVVVIFFVLMACSAGIRSVRDESSDCPEAYGYDPMFEECTPLPDIPPQEEFPEQP